MRSFERGNVPEIGGEYVAVMLQALDDASADELAATPVRTMDGRHDNWFSPASESERRFL